MVTNCRKSYHSIAIDAEGNLYAWGLNNYGQLGDNSTTQRNSPVRISGIGKVTQIAAGYYHSIAIDAEGNLYAWGWNNYGQLGYGYPTNLPEPVFSDIQLKYKYFAVKNNSTLNIPVINSGNKNAAINFKTKNFTAIAGIDYIAKSGTLSFNANEKEKFIQIKILNNTKSNLDRTFQLNLSTNDDIVFNNASKAVITISSAYTILLKHPILKLLIVNLLLAIGFIIIQLLMEEVI